MKNVSRDFSDYWKEIENNFVEVEIKRILSHLETFGVVQVVKQRSFRKVLENFSWHEQDDFREFFHEAMENFSDKELQQLRAYVDDIHQLEVKRYEELLREIDALYMDWPQYSIDQKFQKVDQLILREIMHRFQASGK